MSTISDLYADRRRYMNAWKAEGQRLSDEWNREIDLAAERDKGDPELWRHTLKRINDRFKMSWWDALEGFTRWRYTRPRRCGRGFVFERLPITDKGAYRAHLAFLKR